MNNSAYDIHFLNSNMYSTDQVGLLTIQLGVWVSNNTVQYSFIKYRDDEMH